jgi:PBSX family phage terminase large subunit
VLYAGGVGSAKTTIGVLTTIALAAAYPGDYLVCRQFQPELKLTTYKAFLDMCPKELILEHRVADGLIKIRCPGGKHSNVIFRGLDEPDKHRSLNLNAAYIDESSQVSEGAFLLLQSRLRGPHVRKIYMTTNPAGHDWQYNLFVKQDMLKTEAAKKQFALVQAPSTENKYLPEGYVQSMLDTYSEERIAREVMASFDAFEGAVYPEFRRDIHVIKPFDIPKSWTRVIGIDHGYRNPAAWVWGAVDQDGTIYVYREFYEKEWLIEEICNGKKDKNAPGVKALMKGELIDQGRIDPSTRAQRNEKNGEKVSDFVIYKDALPDDFPLLLANNDVTAGIDRVKSYLKINPNTGKPKMYIFSNCNNVIDEMSKYRYKELSVGQSGQQNQKEEPVKHDDHAMDALRYLVMSQPEPQITPKDIYDKIKFNSLEGSLYRDLERVKNPGSGKDPFEGS